MLHGAELLVGAQELLHRELDQLSHARNQLRLEAAHDDVTVREGLHLTLHLLEHEIVLGPRLQQLPTLVQCADPTQLCDAQRPQARNTVRGGGACETRPRVCEGQQCALNAQHAIGPLAATVEQLFEADLHRGLAGIARERGELIACDAHCTVRGIVHGVFIFVQRGLLQDVTV